jgi:cbb3-type cytochrome oxidase cytochrome c subunit
MENLKEIVWGAVGIWAAVEIFKELRYVWDTYQDNWHRKHIRELNNTIDELNAKLPKKGKK